MSLLPLTDMASRNAHYKGLVSHASSKNGKTPYYFYYNKKKKQQAFHNSVLLIALSQSFGLYSTPIFFALRHGQAQIMDLQVTAGGLGHRCHLRTLREKQPYIAQDSHGTR